MTRNWGLPRKEPGRTVIDAKAAKPLLTLFISFIFGVIGASVAIIGFAGARDLMTGLFHGGSLVLSVLAAGLGCWFYIWLARPRLAEQFLGSGGAFSTLLRFYAKAALVMFSIVAVAYASTIFAPEIVTVLILCAGGGAGAAAAFQTVLAFVPYYDADA